MVPANVYITREMNPFPRIQRHLAAALGRLWNNSWALIQTAVAASLAYFLASSFLGAQGAFYAPIVALVCLSLTLGQPWWRAILITLGVSVGLTVAYLIVLAIGVGSAQIGVVVLLAMVTAVLFSENTLLVNQTVISAILVVVLQPPQEFGFSPDRFLDALIGGGVALAINYLFPADPERMVERAVRPVFDELASSLKEVAAALEDSDLEKAEQALSHARAIDEQISGFQNTLIAAQDTARFSPLKRRELRHLELYSAAADRPGRSRCAERNPRGYGCRALQHSGLGPTLRGRARPIPSDTSPRRLFREFQRSRRDAPVRPRGRPQSYCGAKRAQRRSGRRHACWADQNHDARHTDEH